MRAPCTNRTDLCVHCIFFLLSFFCFKFYSQCNGLYSMYRCAKIALRALTRTTTKTATMIVQIMAMRARPHCISTCATKTNAFFLLPNITHEEERYASICARFTQIELHFKNRYFYATPNCLCVCVFATIFLLHQLACDKFSTASMENYELHLLV